ncbi:MAG: hypothetical protein R2724_21530 [Bryobacterales bacterium]
MKLDNIFDSKHALSRRGFAGLLLLPPRRPAQRRNDDYRRDDDYRRGDDYGRRGRRRRYGGGGYGRIWRAAPSGDNFDPRRPDGRFDLRAFVDGAAEVRDSWRPVAWRALPGRAPRNRL